MYKILGADGNEYGPVTAGKLHEWIAGGRANLQTKAKREGDTEWRTIGDFPELSQFGQTVGNSTPPIYTATVAPGLPVSSGAEVDPGFDSNTRWVRLGASLIDGIISLLFMAPGFALLVAAGIFSHADEPNMPLLIGGFAAFGTMLLVVLGIQIYLLTTRGQTIGKKMLGLKIVTFDTGENPGFVKAVLLRLFVNGLIGAVPGLGPVYSIVDICFIFRADQRCLHDLIAGTKVVKV